MSIDLTDEQLRTVEVFAETLHISRDEVVRGAIDYYFALDEENSVVTEADLSGAEVA